MAFYYVRDDGTATGDGGRFGTKQTGDWDTTLTVTTQFYSSISDALGATTSPVGADFILVSSIHNKVYGSSTVLVGSQAAALLVMSVDDTAIEQYLMGGKEGATTGGGDDLTMSNEWSMYGMTLTANDNTIIGTSSAGNQFYYECTFTAPGASDLLSIAGESTVLVNCEIQLNNVSAGILLADANAFLQMFNGSITTTAAGVNNLFVGAGGKAVLTGVDVSVVTNSIIADYSVFADPSCDFQMHGCKLNASLTAFLNETPIVRNIRFSTTQCSGTSAGAEFQFYLETFEGIMEDQDDAGIHRDESTAFPSGEKVSMKVTSNANCSLGNPFWFDLPARFAELATASTDTLRLYFASTATLTDTEVWAEVSYPDGTTSNEWNYLTNRNTDLLAAGTTHTDDSGSSDWKDGGSDLAGHNEYRMDLDTSSNVGADSVPSIRIYVAVPSTIIYFDTTVDTVA